MPHAFGTKVIQQLVQCSALCALVDYIEEVENSSEEMNMSTTLQGSDSPLYYLDMKRNAQENVFNLLGNKFLEFEARESVCDVFRSLVPSSKVPSLVSYITYKVGKICGLVNHQDVDATFFSAILIQKDTPNGRLHISGVDLPEKFEAGDVVFIDPRVFHQVTFAASEEKRQVVVLTF